jgi:hypothetical protein
MMNWLRRLWTKLPGWRESQQRQREFLATFLRAGYEVARPVCKDVGIDINTEEGQKIVSSLAMVAVYVSGAAENNAKYSSVLLYSCLVDQDLDKVLKDLPTWVDAAQRSGDDELDEVLRVAASVMLERGEALPPCLLEYTIDVLRRPGKRALPHYTDRGGRAVRDRVIALAAQGIVCETNILPTRNRAQQGRESACSLIARALHKAGVNIDEGSVNEIWRKHKKSLESDLGPQWLDLLRKEYVEAQAELKRAAAAYKK